MKSTGIVRRVDELGCSRHHNVPHRRFAIGVRHAQVSFLSYHQKIILVTFDFPYNFQALISLLKCIHLLQI